MKKNSVSMVTLKRNSDLYNKSTRRGAFFMQSNAQTVIGRRLKGGPSFYMPESGSRRKTDAAHKKSLGRNPVKKRRRLL